jgi:hypothetical protein
VSAPVSAGQERCSGTFVTRDAFEGLDDNFCCAMADQQPKHVLESHMKAAGPGEQKIRVGIVGVGNDASSFIQGLTHYRDVRDNEPVPGLMNLKIARYAVRDIEISSTFDVSAAKVGRDIGEAIYAAPNNTHRFANVHQPA